MAFVHACRNSLTLIIALGISSASSLSAQSKAKSTPASKAAATPTAVAPTLVGAWVGTASVPLKDSTIVVPVFYTFTQTGTAVGGTAMVPGQGSGPIANVVQTGTHIAFRVTAPEGKLLEHDGAFTKDGGIEGMVSLDKLPIAKFKIAPKK